MITKDKIMAALIVITAFALLLLTLGLISSNGVKIPFFTAAFNKLTAGVASPDSANVASPDSTNVSSPDSDRGAGSAAAGAGSTAAGAGSAAAGAGSIEAGVANAATGASNAGIPYELKGSGGAWNGAEYMMPILSLSYDINEETEFCLYGKYIAECSRDSFCLLEKSGSEVFRKNIDFTKPAMFKRGDYLLVCDLGGRAAFVMKGAKPVWEDTLAGGIVNASINGGGYTSFVLDATGYRNSVRVFAPMGRHLFDWIVADDYVLNADISPTGRELVINRLKTAGISICSSLEFLDMKSEPFRAIDSDEEDVFLNARYLEDGSLAAVTEDMFYLYSDTGENMIAEKFDHIMAVCEFPRKKAIVAARRNNRAVLMQYGADAPKGQVLTIAEQPVANMTADNEYLFVNYGNEVTAINEKGKTVSRLTPDSEALYGGASEKIGVLVVTKKSADIYGY